MTLPPPKKVVLAYSGGLDTSIILKWLQTEYRAEVVTFTADLGQGEEVTDEVMDGPRSAVWRQAENRMHSARGAMAWMLGVSP